MEVAPPRCSPTTRHHCPFSKHILSWDCRQYLKKILFLPLSPRAELMWTYSVQARTKRKRLKLTPRAESVNSHVASHHSTQLSLALDARQPYWALAVPQRGSFLFKGTIARRRLRSGAGLWYIHRRIYLHTRTYTHEAAFPTSSPVTAEPH